MPPVLWRREETVDEIVQDVSRVVGKLRNRADHQYKAAGHLHETAEKAKQMADSAVDEASRANRLADKFADLIS